MRNPPYSVNLGGFQQRFDPVVGGFLRKEADWMCTYGRRLGRLIRSRRERSGYSIVELARLAYDDETKARRISELEGGKYGRPHAKTYGPLVAFLGITDEEVDACRSGAVKQRVDTQNYRSLLDVFADSPPLYDAAITVLGSKEYPRVMCLGERVVPNPVWSIAVQSTARNVPTVADRLRGHMFLAVTEAERKRPLLYCYWSERWQAYLLPFLMHQNDINGNFNAKDYVSTYVKHQYRSTARATGKFVVSVKQNQEHPTEYWLYAFEFYSLVLPEEFSSKGPCRWLDLDRLSDPKYPEAKINGDVIRAIRAYWGTWLDNLERSAVSVQWSLFGD